MSEAAVRTKWLNTAEAAEYLGLRGWRLQDWRRPGRGGGPPYFRLSTNIVMYALDDLDRFIAAARVVPQATAKKGKGNG